MFQLYSKGCEYAIKALICMSDDGQNFSAKEICRKAKIPESFSRKVFQSLVRGSFLRSVSGPGGGYALTREPKNMTVLDIVNAVDGEKTFDQCVMGFLGCDKKRPCFLHRSWVKTKEGLLTELKSIKLHDLMRMNSRALRRVLKRENQVRAVSSKKERTSQ